MNTLFAAPARTGVRGMTFDRRRWTRDWMRRERARSEHRTMSEAEMARLVVTELQRQGFTTYEEVSAGYSGQRADIVATRGPVLAVVECKTSLSLRLLDQLTEWHGAAHLIIGVVEKGRIGSAATAYLASQGIGLWTVGASEVFEKVVPRLHRRAGVVRLRKALRPEHQSGEYAQAGSMAGGYYSPFRGTVKALQETGLNSAQP